MYILIVLMVKWLFVIELEIAESDESVYLRFQTRATIHKREEIRGTDITRVLKEPATRSEYIFLSHL